MSGPLSGVRIVEMAGIGPCPFAAMMLADMGAEVIRIQAKDARSAIPLLNTRFDVLARGRRSIAIDLKKPGAAEVVLQLIDKADAVVEGFRPGVMERLGLGPDVCLERNSKLVFGRMTGWGQTGPLAQVAGHDLNYVALSGALHAIGGADAPPTVPLNLVGDFGGGGMLLAFGVVCAVLEARQSGRGQVVDAAMTDGAALLSAMMYGFHAGGQWSNQRSDNMLDGAAHFYGNYACRDGKHVSIGAIEPQFYQLLIDKLGLDANEFSAQLDKAQWPQLRKKLEQVFSTRTRDEWVSMLEGSDACFAPVLDWDEAPQHEHNLARGTFIEVAGVTQPAPAPRFSRTPAAAPGAPSAANAHTLEILSDWGIAAERIAAMRSAGAI
jgi:alpha-methylacyl-CoA racemase